MKKLAAKIVLSICAFFLFAGCKTAYAANQVESTVYLVNDESLELSLVFFEGTNTYLHDNVLEMNIGDSFGLLWQTDNDDSLVIMVAEKELIELNLESIEKRKSHGNSFYFRDLPLYDAPYLVYRGGENDWEVFEARRVGEYEVGIYAATYREGMSEPLSSYYQMFKLIITNGEEVKKLSIDAGHKDGLQADITGGRGMDINVSSNTNWNVTVTEGADWITVSQKEGSGNGSFYTTISANSGPEREGWIEVSAPECETIRIRVMQEGVKELADAPKWKKETATVDSLDDVVAFVFQADDSAQYVQLLFEGYNEKNELVESGDLGIFPVRKTGGALSKFKYEIDSMKNFNNTVSKIWMYVCDAAGNALSKTSNPFVINQNNPQSLVPSGNQSIAAPKWAKDNYEIELGEKVPLHYTVDSTAKYVRLYYEVYDEAGQLLDMDSGIYDVTKSQTGSKSKYTVGNATINDHITKFYLTVCNEDGSELYSERSKAMVVRIKNENTWDYEKYDAQNDKNTGLIQLAKTTTANYGYDGSIDLQLVLDSLATGLVKYDELMYGQLIDAFKGNSNTSGQNFEDYIAIYQYKTAIATSLSSIYESDPRYKNELIEKFASFLKTISGPIDPTKATVAIDSTKDGIKLLSQDDVNKIINLLEEVKYFTTRNLILDSDYEAVNKKSLEIIEWAEQALKEYRKIGGKIVIGNDIVNGMEKLGKIADISTVALNLVTSAQIYTADMAKNVEALSILKEAIYNSKQYGIEPNKNLIVAIDQLIKEYKDMKATALEYFIKYVVSTGIDKGLGAALPPVAVYNGIIQTTGGVLSMAGIYDDSEARMFVTYSEGSVFQMLLGGLGEIEYQISKGKGDEIKKSDFEKYKKVALYCYQARLDQIDKLISSGAVSGNDKSNLTRIRQEIEKGMSNIKNEKLCVVN